MPHTTPEEIKLILEEIAGQPVSREDDINVLGRDSLDLLSAYEHIERWARVIFPDRVLVEFKTIGDVEDYIINHSGNNIPE